MCTPDFILYAVFFFFSLMKNPGCKEPNQRTVKVTVLFLSERANIRNMPNCPPAKARLEWGGKISCLLLLSHGKSCPVSSQSAGIVTAKLLLLLFTSWQAGFFFNFYLIFFFISSKTKVLPLCGPLEGHQEPQEDRSPVGMNWATTTSVTVRYKITFYTIASEIRSGMGKLRPGGQMRPV